jgi:hypothetical protein
MKHLLNGVAVAAALAIAAPVWAQNPSGGNSMGMPGPNTGGPGLTPYSGGAPAAPAPMPPPSAGAPPAANSAMPPAHHAVRHARAMHSFHKGMSHKAALTGDTTAQLNREELARIQSGNLSNPAAPPGPGAGAGPGPAPGSDMSSPTTTNRMSTGGRPTSGTGMH